MPISTQHDAGCMGYSLTSTSASARAWSCSTGNNSPRYCRQERLTCTSEMCGTAYVAADRGRGVSPCRPGDARARSASCVHPQWTLLRRAAKLASKQCLLQLVTHLQYVASRGSGACLPWQKLFCTACASRASGLVLRPVLLPHCLGPDMHKTGISLRQAIST